MHVVFFLHVFVPFRMFNGATVTTNIPHWASIKHNLPYLTFCEGLISGKQMHRPQCLCPVQSGTLCIIVHSERVAFTLKSAPSRVPVLPFKAFSLLHPSSTGDFLHTGPQLTWREEDKVIKGAASAEGVGRNAEHGQIFPLNVTRAFQHLTQDRGLEPE